LIKRLGQVSYSFYVFHFIIMYWIAFGAMLVVPPEWLAHGFLFGVAVMSMSVPVAYQVARLSYRFVERPSVGAGASVSKGVERGLHRVFARLPRPGRAPANPLHLTPGVLVLLGALPFLYFAQFLGLSGQSSLYQPANWMKHQFVTSDVLNFHVYALAYPIALMAATIHFSTGSKRVFRVIKYLLGYSLATVAMVSLAILSVAGKKGLGIFDWSDWSRFAEGWISAYGTFYYVGWSIVCAIAWQALLMRLPVIFALASTVLGFLALALLSYAPSLVSEIWLAPWSPLFALLAGSLAQTCMAYRDALREHGLKDQIPPSESIGEAAQAA